MAEMREKLMHFFNIGTAETPEYALLGTGLHHSQKNLIPRVIRNSISTRRMVRHPLNRTRHPSVLKKSILKMKSFKSGWTRRSSSFQ